MIYDVSGRVCKGLSRRGCGNAEKRQYPVDNTGFFLYTALVMLYAFAMKISLLTLAHRVFPSLLLASVCWCSVASAAETEKSPLVKTMGWKGESQGALSDLAEFRCLMEQGADPTLRSKDNPSRSVMELPEQRGSEAGSRRVRANVFSYPAFKVYPACGGLQVPLDEQSSRRPWVLWELLSAEVRPAARGQRMPILVTARVRAAIGADAEVGATVQRLCHSERFDEDVLQTYFVKGRLLWMHPDEELPELWDFSPEQFMELTEALPDGNPWKQAAAVVREQTAFGRESEAFLAAMQQDDAAEVKRMLEAGFDPTRHDAYVEDGTPWVTVLRYYFRGKGWLHSKTDYMQMLMDAGVDINQPAVWGDTPLCYAARWGFSNLMRHLLAHGADATRRSKGGNTALHAAVLAEPETGMPHEGDPEECERRCRELLADYAENIRTLVAAGADVNAVNDAGETPLSLAEKRGNAELIHLLRGEK